MFTHLSAHILIRNSQCEDSDLQISELVSRLSWIQSHCRQNSPPARVQPDAREAPTQSQHRHQSQETTGQTVQLVSTHLLWLLLKCSSPNQLLSSCRRKIELWKWILNWVLEAHVMLSPLSGNYILLRTVRRSWKSFLSLSIQPSSVTMKMKIIYQKRSQPSPPRVWQSQDPAAHWTNRYSRLYTHR